MKFCILEHEEDSPPALLADWATERGHSLDILRVLELELEGWPQLDAYDAVVSLGSDYSVHASEEEWIGPEVTFLRTAHDAGLPVLGICFGAQALAKALGGDVRRGPRVEVGWSTVASAAPSLVSAGPWFRWHEDVFTVPPGACEIARNDIGALAYSLGASIGLQFHPEVDLALAMRWIEPNGGRLLAQGIDQEVLRGEIARAAPGAPERSYDLFDRIASHWWGAAGVRSPSVDTRR